MLRFLNFYRGFTIFLIVLGHCYDITGFNRGNPTFIKKFLMASITGGTMAFVFISGFLFHHVFYMRGFKFKKFMLGKWKNVFMPFLIISMPIFIANIIIIGLPLDQALIKLFLGRFLISTWYIPFALLLFLSSNIFLKFIELPKNGQKTSVMISIFISLLIFRAPIPYEDANVIILSLIHNFIYFISSYLIGIYSSINKKDFLNHVIKYNYIYFFLWVVIVSFQCYKNDYGNVSNFYFDLMYLQKLLMILWTIGLLSKFENKITGKAEKLLATLAEYSFSIFFIHNYFILILGKLNSLFFKGNLNITGFIFVGIFIVFFSIKTAKLVQKIFRKNSRMLIGV